jgi:hypothetical protein
MVDIPTISSIIGGALTMAAALWKLSSTIQRQIDELRQVGKTLVSLETRLCSVETRLAKVESHPVFIQEKKQT